MTQASDSRTGILIILDGFGINPDSRFNSVAMAKKPTLDYLVRTYPNGALEASESFVGLPKGFMGNSEVGHLNIGAGRVVFQDFSLISKAIADGSFFENPALLKLTNEIRDQKGRATLHLIGLVSDGGVHSHISHLYALIQLAKKQGISTVAIHIITDGRDTSPTSGAGFVSTLQEYCRDSGVGYPATVSGRFYAMDRDNRWERTSLAYRCIVQGKAEDTFSDPVEYIQRCYERNTTDEFLPPAVGARFKGIADGDGVIFFNFRADRARPLTRAITQTDFSFFQRDAFPRLTGFVCLTPYDSSFHLPSAYEKPKVPNTIGEIVSRMHWKQLRIAETEKYAHVTYFFNGGDEKVFDGEKRILIPSPRDVKTYDLKPEMSADQVTSKLMEELKTGEYRFVVVNFANCDMVGHTGNLRAAIKAVETVDECLGKIVKWVEANGAFALLTADHGNCEKMQDPSGMPLTSHTLAPVPLIVIDPTHQIKAVKLGGSLCDIAPTLLNLWGIKNVPEMTGQNLALRDTKS